MKKSEIKWTPEFILGGLTAMGLVFLGVGPILPESAPDWLHVWLPFAGALVALVTQSLRRILPTPEEAVKVIEANPAAAAAALDGRETLPPTEPKS